MKPEIVMDFARLTAAHGTQHPSGEMLYSFYYEHLLDFAEMIEREVREEDRENALAYLRMLHDSFSLASKEKP
jgi:hypothetical protein